MFCSPIAEGLAAAEQKEDVLAAVRAWFARDACLLHEVVDEYLRACTMPLPARWSQINRAEERMLAGLGPLPADQSEYFTAPDRLGEYIDRLPEGATGESVTQFMRENMPPLLIAALFMPALGPALEAEARAAANLRLAGAALAVEEYRLKNGRWPKSLDLLVPAFLEEAPRDPFADDATIVYRRTATGVQLHSIGQDREDDGGTTRREAKERAGGETADEGWDIVFRLLDPERRGRKAVTFHEEIAALDPEFGWGTMNSLKQVGLTPDRLKELGFTDEELAEYPDEEEEEEDD
jgi:hypothetical protein